MRDTEPLLAHLRAMRDEALALSQAPTTSEPLAWWHTGQVAALERAIVAIVRWESGQDPDPSVKGGT